MTNKKDAPRSGASEPVDDIEDACCESGTSCCNMDRRDFVKAIGLGGALAATMDPTAAAEPPGEARPLPEIVIQALRDESWPILRHYDQDHLARIALPLGGIGTGTVSLGGRGDLRDWEIMNRPAKKYIPVSDGVAPFFALFTKTQNGQPVCRILEGPIDYSEYEGSQGSAAPNVNFPRFRHCAFGAAYPLGRVMLSDPHLPVEVHLKAFNPFIPCDDIQSGIPVAVLTYEIHNRTGEPVSVSVCGSMPNFIGNDGGQTGRDAKGDPVQAGSTGNRNEYRSGQHARGIFMQSAKVDRKSAAWGTMALATTSRDGCSYRVCWEKAEWGTPLLDFWDDFSTDGKIDPREPCETDAPTASLAISFEIPPGVTKAVTFLIAWHFPNRYTWTPRKGAPADEEIIGNYYTTKYLDAWDVIEKAVLKLAELESRTIEFTKTLCSSALPLEVKEAALFNLSTLRTQTCFRTPDGRFYGWEGCNDRQGCCHGSCTHVWNYEQATAFLFGGLAISMREVEFAHATSDDGMMSFRVHLPLSRGQAFGKAAADGQMGCIMKMYRDWQLSGDEARLRQLWPRVKKALGFCWIPGGWDADRDGVMEGCQHNTMDVEYYGPNPQMGAWYLGALRAGEEMAHHVGDRDFAATCRDLFEKGSRWIDANLFNGEYYEHRIQPPKNKSEVAPSLLVGMGAKDITKPDYQLGEGCLVDQLVGQYMAHVCGLGYLLNPDNIRKTLRSILKYNLKEDLTGHFNCLRSFALDGESALLMASYPKQRPVNPFPYFTEVMTGFEYAATVGMLYEGMLDEGLRCIRYIRDRYDGRKRNPFDEAECGHHYARAMASWAAVLALTGFRYSGVEKTISFAAVPGTHFWSNGYAWGDCELIQSGRDIQVRLAARFGELSLRRFNLRGFATKDFEQIQTLRSGEEIRFTLNPRGSGQIR